MLVFTMLLWLPEGCLAAAAAGNTKPAAPVRSGAAPAAQGKIVASIEGSKITLPPLLTLEARRERRMAGRAVNDPNLKLISDRLMTQASIWHIPEDYKTVPIMGDADVTPTQAVALLELYNPRLPIAATPEEIVDFYYNEARQEGIRWDLAFCQALLETGFFTFGGSAAACLVFDVLGAMVEARPKFTVTNFVGRVAYTNDIRRHRPLEVWYTNGYVRKRAGELGIPVPVNDRLCELIREIEAGTRKACRENLSELILAGE